MVRSMSPIVSLKILFPGYRKKWKRNSKAMLKELNQLCEEVNFLLIRGIPEITLLENKLKFRGFKTNPDYLDIFSILKPWIPKNLEPECFRLALDVITRYKYPHMRPDLSLNGYDVSEMFGFHGQHKDNIFSIESKSDRERLIRSFLPQSDDIIIDCGSYIGLGDIRLSKEVDKGKIIAIEASRDCFELLSHNIRSNNIKNIIPLHKAIWNSKCTINLNTGNAQANSLINEISKWDSSELVEAISIDEVVAEMELTKVSMISLTLNGAEVEAIDGAKNTLKKYKPRIRLAGWYSRGDKRIADILKPKLEQYGYETFIGPRGNFMALSRE